MLVLIKQIANKFGAVAWRLVVFAQNVKNVTMSHYRPAWIRTMGE